MSSNQSGEGEIRRALIEADLVDCMVALPGQLFYSTQIPVCLWFLAKNKNADAKRGFRDRRKQTLFIDARKLGTLIDRVHRELTDADLEKITSTYHAWRGDVPGSARAPRAVSGAPPETRTNPGAAPLFPSTNPPHESKGMSSSGNGRRSKSGSKSKSKTQARGDPKTYSENCSGGPDCLKYPP
jgi:type I restriction-modification system DNA methylase subunit